MTYLVESMSGALALCDLGASKQKINLAFAVSGTQLVNTNSHEGSERTITPTQSNPRNLLHIHRLHMNVLLASIILCHLLST